MILNENALNAAMDADLDRMWGECNDNLKPTDKEREQFKMDNRDEYVATIAAYLNALERLG